MAVRFKTGNTATLTLAGTLTTGISTAWVGNIVSINPGEWTLGERDVSLLLDTGFLRVDRIPVQRVAASAPIFPARDDRIGVLCFCDGNIHTAINVGTDRCAIVVGIAVRFIHAGQGCRVVDHQRVRCRRSDRENCGECRRGSCSQIPDRP